MRPEGPVDSLWTTTLQATLAMPRNTPQITGMRAAVAAMAMAVAMIGFAAAPAHAQYDRDGRYVPSPMGVPQDPYARPVPGYSGSPGVPKGTPIWPRGAIPGPAPQASMARAPNQPVYPRRDQKRRVVIDCRRPWTPELNVPEASHRWLCAKARKPRPGNDD